jgi:hypothetical protein
LKLPAAFAGVLVVAQVVQRPPQPPTIRLDDLRKAVQPLGAEPIDVFEAEKAWGGTRDLLPLLQSADPSASAAAMRALGRLKTHRSCHCWQRSRRRT